MNVLSSAKFILERSVHVQVKRSVDYDILDVHVHEIHPEIHGMWHNMDGHPPADHPALFDYIFLLDSLNFSFWPEDAAHEWTIEGRRGYAGFVTALGRASREGIKLYRPETWQSLTLESMQHIFRTDQGIVFPMLQERLAILQENGSIITEYFQGSIINLLNLCTDGASGRISIPKCLELIVTSFPSFNDSCEYAGQLVCFYKRAQIFLADCYAASEEGESLFSGIQSLTMFADYRVPQVLLALGLIEYDDDVKRELRDPNTRIAAGSSVECEIRAASIMAVELWSRSTGKLPMAIDFALWNWAGEHQQETSKYPMHRTRTIFY